jgi:membrane dipeptidase
LRILTGIFLALAVWAAHAQTPQQRYDTLMRDLLILDSHIDTPGYVVDEGYQLGEEHRYYETDIPRLKRGKVGAVFFGVYVQPQDFPPDRWLGRALEWVDAVHQEAKRNAASMEVAYTADDIERIRRSGKIAALISLEGGHLIQDSIPVMRDFYRLGVRYMTLAHFKNNNWADSGTDRPVHNGLSDFGREVVREMNRLGMMVDISHVSDKTFYDVLETTNAPVIASHSDLRAVCDIPRNMNDDMLRALAKNGGVVFINFNAAYLDRAAYDVFDPLRSVRDAEIKQMMEKNAGNPERYEMRRAIQKKYRQKLPNVDRDAILRHIDHAVKIMGADHVGLGSDFDGISGMTPKGMEDVSKYPDLVKGMIELGYSDSDIRKIAGQNMLRVMRANEAIAKKMATK